MNSTWYSSLHRPPLTPPDRIFAPVWTVLYVMIAVSIFLYVWKHGRKKPFQHYVLIAIHLACNLIWTWLFFGLRSPGLALLDIFILDSSLAVMIILFWKENRISSILLWPYMAWVLFATYLNAGFYLLNR